MEVNLESESECVMKGKGTRIKKSSSKVLKCLLDYLKRGCHSHMLNWVIPDSEFEVTLVHQKNPDWRKRHISLFQALDCSRSGKMKYQGAEKYAEAAKGRFKANMRMLCQRGYLEDKGVVQVSKSVKKMRYKILPYGTGCVNAYSPALSEEKTVQNYTWSDQLTHKHQIKESENELNDVNDNMRSHFLCLSNWDASLQENQGNASNISTENSVTLHAESSNGGRKSITYPVKLYVPTNVILQKRLIIESSPQSLIEMALKGSLFLAYPRDENSSNIHKQNNENILSNVHMENAEDIECDVFLNETTVDGNYNCNNTKEIREVSAGSKEDNEFHLNRQDIVYFDPDIFLNETNVQDLSNLIKVPAHSMERNNFIIDKSDNENIDPDTFLNKKADIQHCKHPIEASVPVCFGKEKESNDDKIIEDLRTLGDFDNSFMNYNIDWNNFLESESNHLENIEMKPNMQHLMTSSENPCLPRSIIDDTSNDCLEFCSGSNHSHFNHEE